MGGEELWAMLVPMRSDASSIVTKRNEELRVQRLCDSLTAKP